MNNYGPKEYAADKYIINQAKKDNTFVPYEIQRRVAEFEKGADFCDFYDNTNISDYGIQEYAADKYIINQAKEDNSFVPYEVKRRVAEYEKGGNPAELDFRPKRVTTVNFSKATNVISGLVLINVIMFIFGMFISLQADDVMVDYLYFGMMILISIFYLAIKLTPDTKEIEIDNLETQSILSDITFKFPQKSHMNKEQYEKAVNKIVAIEKKRNSNSKEINHILRCRMEKRDLQDYLDLSDENERLFNVLIEIESIINGIGDYEQINSQIKKERGNNWYVYFKSIIKENPINIKDYYVAMAYELVYGEAKLYNITNN